jgi:hypothetical protein
MKITYTVDNTPRPAILAMFQNADHTVTIKVLDDTSYEITRNGVTTKTDMTKWYFNGHGVIRHIENDIKAGYYPGVRRTA